MNQSSTLIAALGEGEENSWGIIDILTLLLVFFIILYVNEISGGNPAAVDAVGSPPGLAEQRQPVEAGPAAATETATGPAPGRATNPFAAPHPLMLAARNDNGEQQSASISNGTVNGTVTGSTAGVAAYSASTGAANGHGGGLAGRVQAHFAGPQPEGFTIDRRQAAGVTLIIEERLAFASGSAELVEQAHAVLDQLAGLLAGQPEWKVKVAGHSDDRPINNASFASNWYLSTARAVAVTEYLLAKGVAPERLTPEGHAEFQPRYANDSPANRARNRRVEITLLSPAGNPAPARL